MAPAGFKGQANALLRKNLVFQRRRICTNLCIILLPIAFVALLFALQFYINSLLDSRDNRCGCLCVECCLEVDPSNCRSADADNQCKANEECKTYNDDVCGPQFSDVDQIFFCSIPHPSSWPPVMTIPRERDRAGPWRPGLAMLFNNGSIAEKIVKFMLPEYDSSGGPSQLAVEHFIEEAATQDAFRGEVMSVSGLNFGSPSEPTLVSFVEPAFVSGGLSSLTQNCDALPQQAGAFGAGLVQGIAQQAQAIFDSDLDESGGNDSSLLTCVDTPFVGSTVDKINEVLFCSFEEARCDISGEYSHAWDFKESSNQKMDVDIWYQDTELSEDDDGGGPGGAQRISLAQNLAAEGWIKYATGNKEYSSQLLALEEMPKPGTKLNIDLASVFAILLFTWVIQLMMPLMLVQLVYEKEERLRIMMKMHGLGDVAYWLINYMYYLLIYVLYILVLMAIGSALNLQIFRRNGYDVQLVFYFLFGNVQIAFAFVLSSLFKGSRTSMVFAFLWVFGTGLIGYLLLAQLFDSDKWYIRIIELIPAFGAYRGLFELGQYSFRATLRNNVGLTWEKFGDSNNHMGYIMIVFVVEWLVFMVLAWYLEQVMDAGTGVQQHWLFFLEGLWKKKNPYAKWVKKGEVSEYIVEPLPHVKIETMSEDIQEEHKRVQEMNQEELNEHMIVVNGLRKVFPPAEGNPAKVAVQDLTLGVKKGEVFGLLGPNGAGKTTSINMLIGFLSPTRGDAMIGGYDLDSEIGQIYTIMGVCPQHDLLWGTLTAFEHLYFYGRLKGLNGSALREAAENALRSVNLFHAGVGKKRVGTYSGGMKRRLSVAISLIGQPQVVYLDEPSTGLDPASRHNLWKVVKSAKRDKAIILTTHSMKEAEVLCDRLGIFVGGQLVVIGNPKELTARYGGYLVFTLTTRVSQVQRATELVHNAFPSAVRTYQVSGTIKFELPAAQVSSSSVFDFMERAKHQIQVMDWGVANVTLEEVFIKVAKDAGAQSSELT